MQKRILILGGLLVTAVSSCVVQEVGSAPPQTIKVYKNSGAVQCGTVGVPVEVMEKTLTMNGIEVLSSFCAHDGYLRSAVCGAGTGLINVYEIETRYFQKAIDLRFGEVGKLPQYRTIPCRTPNPSSTSDTPNRDAQFRHSDTIPFNLTLDTQPAPCALFTLMNFFL